MKKTPTIVAVCTLTALPVGVVIAADPIATKTANIEVKAEETKTINLKITGMT